MAGLPADFGGSDILCNDIVFGVSATQGQSGPITGAAAPATAKIVVRGVNFNAATTDTLVPISLPSGVKNYKVASININNASGTLTTATLGVFGAAGGGSPTIAADQAITVTSGTANTALNTQALTLSPAATICFNYSTLYVRVGTPQGTAATADVAIVLNLLG